MARPIVESESVVILAGETESLINIPANTTIKLTPGATGTMTCQVREAEGGELSDIDAAEASYSAATRLVTAGPVYEVVFGAVTDDGAASITYQRRYA